MLGGMLVHRVTPILNVSSLDESVAWFEKLGWSKLWDWGEPATFGAVGNGPCEIFLAQDGQGARGVWMSVWVDDVDALLQVCLDEGVLVIRPPRDEPWGVREMHIRHPDGHVFRMSQPAAHDPDHSHHHGHDHPHDHDGHHHHH